MMLHRFLAVLTLSLMILAPAARAADFIEGVDYLEIIPQPVETGAKVEVREFFWYGCPHCYHLEPTLKPWLARLPSHAQFVRAPAALNPDWAVHARAYYAFEALGVTARLHGPLFDAIHRDRKPLFTAEAIADFVATQGVDRKRFLDTMSSFAVDGKVRQVTIAAQAANINSVPTMLVGGRYVTSVSMAGGQDRLMKVLDHLIAKVAAENKRR
jgi:thiol:disulfide interchange protein DsbA